VPEGLLGAKRAGKMRSVIDKIAATFRRWPTRLAVAGVLFLASVTLLVIGLAGLLMTGSGEATRTYVGQFRDYSNWSSTATATPVPTPPPSDAPIARMIIDKLGVDAPVVSLGLDENGVPMVPDNPYDVVWYDFTSRPGWGSNAVFSGHVDWVIWGRPVIGVFYYLRDLDLDDEIKIVLEDGTEYHYKVTANRALPSDDPEVLSLMGPTPEDVVTLITCGGTWIRDYREPLGGRYTDRQIVRAGLIQEDAEKREPPPEDNELLRPQAEPPAEQEEPPPAQEEPPPTQEEPPPAQEEPPPTQEEPPPTQEEPPPAQQEEPPPTQEEPPPAQEEPPPAQEEPPQ
jgi:sortase (surface protein transpeptidase)